jgi:hypothetical protein
MLMASASDDVMRMHFSHAYVMRMHCSHMASRGVLMMASGFHEGECFTSPQACQPIT